MSTKTTYRTTFKGVTATRTSAHPYTYAVWVVWSADASRLLDDAEVPVGKPFVCRWTTRRDLAEKEANTLRMGASHRGLYEKVAVVPVVV